MQTAIAVSENHVDLCSFGVPRVVAPLTGRAHRNTWASRLGSGQRGPAVRKNAGASAAATTLRGVDARKDHVGTAHGHSRPVQHGAEPT